MERFVLQKLIEWKESKYRKPLILRGVRQCGKTWALLEFGKRNYSNTVYFNFDEHPEYRDIFIPNRDIPRILDNLRVAASEAINPGTTLIIFDEVQEAPEVLSALKYFQENHPEYHVVCAGSLLGIRLASGVSFPVGKVDFMDVRPMTFTEFLIADGNENLVSYMENISQIEPVPSAFFTKLQEKLKLYLIIGGMPAAVKAWVEDRDIDQVQQLLSYILLSYDADFSKHLSTSESQRVSLVWKSIPSQLANENKKFIYSLIKDHAKAREYEPAIQWLSDADMIFRVNRNKAPGLPISANDDFSAFKLYAADVGLLRRMALLEPSVLIEGDKLFTGFKGALTENYILQSLSAQYEAPLRYWTTYNPTYEVDFILQHKNDIIPIEVKAGKDTKGKGIAIYKEKYPQSISIRIRYSLNNLNLTDDLLNIPLYLADYTPQLIETALQNAAITPT
jgi:predicted AAA+ superfamily ATPase